MKEEKKVGLVYFSKCSKFPPSASIQACKRFLKEFTMWKSCSVVIWSQARLNAVFRALIIANLLPWNALNKIPQIEKSIGLILGEHGRQICLHQTFEFLFLNKQMFYLAKIGWVTVLLKRLRVEWSNNFFIISSWSDLTLICCLMEGKQVWSCLFKLFCLTKWLAWTTSLGHWASLIN